MKTLTRRTSLLKKVICVIASTSYSRKQWEYLDSNILESKSTDLMVITSVLLRRIHHSEWHSDRLNAALAQDLMVLEVPALEESYLSRHILQQITSCRPHTHMSTLWILAIHWEWRAKAEVVPDPNLNYNKHHLNLIIPIEKHRTWLTNSLNKHQTETPLVLTTCPHANHQATRRPAPKVMRRSGCTDLKRLRRISKMKNKCRQWYMDKG